MDVDFDAIFSTTTLLVVGVPILAIFVFQAVRLWWRGRAWRRQRRNEE